MAKQNLKELRRRMDAIRCCFMLNSNLFLDIEKNLCPCCDGGFFCIGKNNLGMDWNDEISKNLLKYLFGNKKESDFAIEKVKQIFLENQAKTHAENQNKKEVVTEKIGGFVYLIKSRNLYKIGRTFNPKNRLTTYRTENPHGLKCLLMVEVDNCVATEEQLLKKYKNKNHKGEWHKLTQNDVKQIKDFLNHGKN